MSISRSRGACVLFAVTTLFPAIVLAFQSELRKAWEPDLSSETIVFLSYRVHDAAHWFGLLTALDAIWALLFIAVVLRASTLHDVFGKRFIAALLLAQAFALACMVASPFPMDSDQFAYVYYGDLTLRGINPYTAYDRPLALAPQEARIAVHWGNPPVVDRYGPAWTLANAAVLAPARATAEAQARLERVFAAFAALLCTLVLVRIVPLVPWSESAIVAFALNPLVIVAVGNGGHNDIYLVLFGLIAWWLGSLGLFELAGVALATASCVKFAYGLFFPALLGYTYYVSRSLTRTALTIGTFLLAVVLFSLPLGIRTSLVAPALDWNAAHASRITHYLWRAVVHIPHLGGVPNAPFGSIVPLATVACALAIATLALRGRRSPALEIAMAPLILMVPPKIESWYGIMLTPLLLVKHRFALIVFVAMTLACQFLQSRLFLVSYDPYLIFTALVVLIVALLAEVRPIETAAPAGN